jgi:hypothetical protein
MEFWKSKPYCRDRSKIPKFQDHYSIIPIFQCPDSGFPVHYLFHHSDLPHHRLSRASFHPHKSHRKTLLLDSLVIDTFELIVRRVIGQRVSRTGIVHVASSMKTFVASASVLRPSVTGSRRQTCLSQRAPLLYIQVATPCGSPLPMTNEQEKRTTRCDMQISKKVNLRRFFQGRWLSSANERGC